MITISLAAFDVMTALPFLHGLREADLGSEARLWRTSRQEPNIDAVRDRNPGPTSYPSFEFLDLTGILSRTKLALICSRKCPGDIILKRTISPG
jgi:hypothetical protein